MPDLEPGAVAPAGFTAMTAELKGANADVDQYVRSISGSVALRRGSPAPAERRGHRSYRYKGGTVPAERHPLPQSQRRETPMCSPQ